MYTAYDVVGFTVLLVNMMSILQSSKSLQNGLPLPQGLR